jgi:GT2 family glycosyltransferase
MSPYAVKPALCILNYNGEAILPLALQTACTIAAKFAEIVVLDNGSQDGSLELIRRDFPQVRILELGQNLGAAGGRNAGLTRLKSDLILLMDNDVALTAECVDRLVEALEARPNAAIAVPAVIYGNQRDRIQYCGAECHFLGQQILVNENVPVDRIAPGIAEMGSLVSCCFLVDRSRLPGPEVFDDAFFIYFEDHEYGVRVRALGPSLIAVPAARCYHGSGTEGLSIRQLGSYSSRRIFFLIRNRWLFLLKIYSLRTWLVLLPIFLFYEASQFVIIVKKGWLREWWRSVVWVLGHLRSILRERQRFQRLRRRHDGDLVKGGSLPFRSELTSSAFERWARRVLDGVAAGYWVLASRLIRRDRTRGPS